MIEIKHDFEENKLKTLAFLQTLDSYDNLEKKQRIYDKLQELNFWLLEKFTVKEFNDSSLFFKYTLMKYSISLN